FSGRLPLARSKRGWSSDVCASDLRILRQDLWEAMITSIVSQQNNIPRIRKCIQIICERYGQEKQTDEGKQYYDFPTPEALANATEEELKACNLGYRSRYIKKTAWSVMHNEICLSELYTMNHTDAKKELLKLYGVGNKVADCICLFALHHIEAFPIDTHIQQVLRSEERRVGKECRSKRWASTGSQ